MDLLLDSTGDLDFEGADFHTVTGGQEIVQRLELRLGVRRGEWDLNLLFGPDYIGIIFGKGTSTTIIDAHLKEIILGTDGVDRLISYTSAVAGRTLTVTFEVGTVEGQVIDGQLATDPEGSAGAFQNLITISARCR